jgi:hypothetical protein
MLLSMPVQLWRKRSVPLVERNRFHGHTTEPALRQGTSARLETMRVHPETPYLNPPQNSNAGERPKRDPVTSLLPVEENTRKVRPAPG